MGGLGVAAISNPRHHPETKTVKPFTIGGSNHVRKNPRIKKLDRVGSWLRTEAASVPGMPESIVPV